jgi:hypothetical protein
LARQNGSGAGKPEISLVRREWKPGVLRLFPCIPVRRKGRRIFRTQAAGVLSSRFSDVKGFHLTFTFPNVSLSHKFKIIVSDLVIGVGGKLWGMLWSVPLVLLLKHPGGFRETAVTGFKRRAS